MPNVNPAADRNEAMTQPVVILRDGADIGYLANLGAIKRADTLPYPSHYQFVVLRSIDGSKFSGYLWKEEDGSERYAGGSEARA